MTRGRRTGRTAYVLREWDLPTPLPGAEWAADSKFNAAEALQNDPQFKATIAAALKSGVEIVGAVELKMKRKLSVGLPDGTRIVDVDLPTRIQNVLASNGIKTVGELRKTGDDALLSFQDLGSRSVAFIREHLRDR
jgi:DNA-directed RNA polymerase alpha subunit